MAVELGATATQLRVTVTSTVANQFGAVIGVRAHHAHASATADYQGPAPMGSPCNTFGNEPRCRHRCRGGRPARRRDRTR